VPLYEYLCESCGRRSEVLQRLDEPPLAACPHCGGKVRKLLSAPAFQFKGSGWYLTDYARKGTKGEGGAAGAESAESKTAKAKPEGESAAPAAPKESKPAPSGGDGST